jgi:hypothetical protein
VKGNEEASRLVTGLFDRLAESQLEIRDLHNAKALDCKTVREVIFGLSNAKPEIPEWVINPPKAIHSPGVPTLFASDWHWGEVVDPEQINGVNKFNLRIAHARAKKLVERSIDLLKNHMVNPTYPGIVFPLGGDMVSGDIHDELRESNELATIPTVLDLLEVLCASVKALADAFGHVHVPCVTGNHGRCHLSDTNVLTKDGWVNIASISEGDVVASVDLESGKMGFYPCLGKVSFKERGYFTLESAHHDEAVSMDHSVIFRGGRLKVQELGECRTGDFTYCCDSDMETYAYDKDWIRMIVWAVCDGTFVDRRNYNETGFRLQFKLSKPRKIESLTKLLTRMGIPFTLKPATKSPSNVLDPFYIRVYGEYAKKLFFECTSNGKKQFPSWFKTMNRECVMEAIDTISETDGQNKKGIIFWSSVSKVDVETVQIACVTHGIPTSIAIGKRSGGFPNSSIRFDTTIMPQGFSKRASCRHVKKGFVDAEAEFVGIQTIHGTLLTQRNGKVVLSGNSTIKMRAKGRVHTSYDWLLYCLLEREFKNDKRITFQVSSGPDVSYSIFGHRYLLTHGDQFRGGDGMVGALGPILRGDHKKRSRNGQIGLEFDTMLLGHWHQYCHLGRVIVNGSLKGYCEYANANNFGFEQPKQALFMTHPRHGITFAMPVVLENAPVRGKKWIDFE